MRIAATMRIGLATLMAVAPLLVLAAAAPPLVLLVSTGRTWCVRLMRGRCIAP
jgi:hypothetical protein